MQEVHVVSLSGGESSGYLVELMEDKRINHGWDVHYIFMDTGAEHPKTYEFIKNIVRYWGIKLVCIRAKVNPEFNIGVSYSLVDIEDLKPDLQPWIDMVAKYGTPTINTPYCTSRLKTEPHDKYCDEVFGRGNYVTWLGIRADEPNRLKHFNVMDDMFDSPKKAVRPIRYLAELSNFGKKQIVDWWQKQPFNLDLDYELGNCVFCIKKSLVKLVAAAIKEPFFAEKFNAVIMDNNVRILENAKYDQGVIYRGKLSTGEVVRLSKILPLENLEERIAELEESENDDPTVCSTSCEVFDDYVEQQSEFDYQAA